MKEWKELLYERCPKCFGNVEVLADENRKDEDNYDGEAVRCIECGMSGKIQCDNVDEYEIEWDEEAPQVRR